MSKLPVSIGNMSTQERTMQGVARHNAKQSLDVYPGHNLPH